MTCTVVTAIYPIKSKFSILKYLEWGNTFLKLESPIVLFTEENLVEDIKRLRGNKPIQIIVIPFDELDTWKLYKDKWVEHHTFDPERNIHTPELYAIWAQKAFFVEKAIQQNFFNTEHFFWCDFGAFRNPNISQSILASFPTIDKFPKNILLLQSIGDLLEEDILCKEDGIPGIKEWHSGKNDRLVGGLWGGDIIACLNWKAAYQKMLEIYFKIGRFAGKDQNVMLSSYLQNPELAIVVKPTKLDIDCWFHFHYLLSTENVEFKENITYKIPLT